MVYAETMQEIALSLMADKMQVALAVEGDLSDKGLTALAEGDTSILIKMAKSLLGEESHGRSEERWGGLLDAEIRADERLDDTDTDVHITQTTTIKTDIAATGSDNVQKTSPLSRWFAEKCIPKKDLPWHLFRTPKPSFYFQKERFSTSAKRSVSTTPRVTATLMEKPLS